MALFSEPFSVPDDLADGWDDMVRRNRLIQALNDPGFADDDQEPAAAPDDVSGQLRQAQMPIEDWLGLRSDQLAQQPPPRPLAAAGEQGDDTVSAGEGSDQVEGGIGADTVSAPASSEDAAKRAAARDYGAHYIIDLVPTGEKTASYDASFNNADGSGRNYPVGWKKPTELTVDQAIQIGPYLKQTSGGDVIGKYQFTPTALGDLKRSMNLSGSELLTGDMQDRMARERLHFRKYDDFLAGAITPEDFQKKLAKEWPSLAGAPSAQQFDGRRVRTPVVSAVDVSKALNQAADEGRAEIQRYLDEGHLPPHAAWREPPKP